MPFTYSVRFKNDTEYFEEDFAKGHQALGGNKRGLDYTYANERITISGGVIWANDGYTVEVFGTDFFSNVNNKFIYLSKSGNNYSLTAAATEQTTDDFTLIYAIVDNVVFDKMQYEVLEKKANSLFLRKNSSGNYLLPDNNTLFITPRNQSGSQIEVRDANNLDTILAKMFWNLNGHFQIDGYAHGDLSKVTTLELLGENIIKYNGKQILLNGVSKPTDYLLWSGISWVNDGQVLELDMQGFQYSDFYELHLTFAGYVAGGSTTPGKTHTHILPISDIDIPNVFELYGNTYISIPKNLNGESGVITKGLSFSATENTVVGKTDPTPESNEWALVGIRARKL